MADQKLVATHHFHFFPHNYPTRPKKFGVFPKKLVLWSLVHFDYFSLQASLFYIICLNLDRDSSKTEVSINVYEM